MHKILLSLVSAIVSRKYRRIIKQLVLQGFYRDLSKFPLEEIKGKEIYTGDSAYSLQYKGRISEAYVQDNKLEVIGTDKEVLLELEQRRGSWTYVRGILVGNADGDTRHFVIFTTPSDQSPD